MLWKVPLRPCTNTDATSACARAHTHTTHHTPHTHTHTVCLQKAATGFLHRTPHLYFLRIFGLAYISQVNMQHRNWRCS
jgi:hypothetical protein